MPQVSIIMNSRNSAKYLREALDSVYRQTYKDFEIIFWDNQSTDGSGKIARSYGKPLKYFRGEEYLPLGAARNAAIEKATGKYIAFLDCDDIWLPEKLEKQVALLESNENLGLIYSDCYFIDSAGTEAKNTLFNNRLPFRGMVFKELFQENLIAILTAVVTRDAIKKVGVINPKYEIGEEYDLWLRIAQEYPIDFINEPLAKYRIHGESATLKNRILNYKEDLQIRGYWLKKNPTLEKELGGKAKALKYWPIFLGALGYIYRTKNFKAVRESIGLIKYMLLQEYEKD